MIEIDNVQSGPPAAGLLTKLKKNGELYKSNWKNPAKYRSASTQFAVKEAREILLDWT